MSKDEALRLAALWQAEGFAIAWTAGKSGDDAKAVKTKGWNENSVVIPPGADLENAAGQIANRLARKNPVVTARRSNLVLIDCDSPEDVAHFKSFRPPRTRSVRTRAGRHFYYRPDEGMEAGGVYFENGGITPKSDCYLVTPPALHPSGVVYEWEGDDVPIAVLPADVHRAMAGEASAAQVRTDGRLEDDGEVVEEGERHAWLARKVGALANHAVSEAWLVEQAHTLNELKCRPPKPRNEVERMARAFWKDRKSKVNVAMRVEEEAHRDKALRQHNDRPQTSAAVDDLDDGLSQETRWFKNFEKVVPVGFHIALVAPGGTGKGLFTMFLAASMTEGPLLYSGSEDNRNLLKQRIAAAGVRPGAFKRVRVPDGDTDRQFSFPTDVEFLEELIVATRASVFVYDAGPAHLDHGLKNDKVEDVRSAVDRLSEVAERTGCTVVAILHPGKSKEVSARDLALGSKAWIDSVRHALFMVEDDEEDGIVHLEVTKTNIGEKGYGWMMAIRERLVDALDADGKQIKTPAGYLELLGRSLKSVDVILGRDSKQKAVMKWVLGYLAERGGRMESDALKANAMEEIDCRERTVRRALEALKKHGKIEAVKEGFAAEGVWFTQLTSGDAILDAKEEDGFEEF